MTVWNTPTICHSTAGPSLVTPGTSSSMRTRCFRSEGHIGGGDFAGPPAVNDRVEHADDLPFHRGAKLGDARHEFLDENALLQIGRAHRRWGFRGAARR